MKKWQKISLSIFGLFIAAVIATPTPKEENTEASKKEVQEPTAIKSQLGSHDILTLGQYKESLEKQKKEYIGTVFLSNKWTKKNFEKYLDDYYNCMGDFAYQKDPNLTFIEVFKWCDNERANNYQSFLSHINELDVRNSDNYKISFDENIALLKKEKLLYAIKQAKMKEKNDYKKRDIKLKPSKFNTAREVIEYLNDFSEDMQTFEEYSKNHIRLSTTFVDGDIDKYVLEEVKRTFIYGIFRVFIHSDIEEIQLTVVPLLIDLKPYKTIGYKKEFSITGTIKREDALNVAKKLLNIESFNELVKITRIDNFQTETWNSTMLRAIYNDQGSPTLNLFFQELSKVTY